MYPWNLVLHLAVIVILVFIIASTRKGKARLYIATIKDGRESEQRVHHWPVLFIPLAMAPFAAVDPTLWFPLNLIVVTLHVIMALVYLIDEWDDIEDAIRESGDDEIYH